MKRFFLLVMLVLAFSYLPGCGGGAKPSPEVQKKTLDDTEAQMQKGMEAMKGMKPG